MNFISARKAAQLVKERDQLTKRRVKSRDMLRRIDELTAILRQWRLA